VIVIAVAAVVHPDTNAIDWAIGGCLGVLKGVLGGGYRVWLVDIWVRGSGCDSSGCCCSPRH
jgi:hypothetical protein